MDWDIKTLVNDPDWQALPYEERFKAIKEVDPDFAALPAAERFKGIQEMKGIKPVPTSREDILTLHRAHEAAGAEADIPAQRGIMAPLLQGGAVSAAKMVEGLPSAGQALYQAISRPADPATAKMLGGMAAGMVTQPIKDIQKIATGTPEEVGEGLVNLAPQVVPAAKLTAGAGRVLGSIATEGGPAAARRIVQSILKPAEGDFKFSKEPVNAFLEEKFTGSLPKIRRDVVARKTKLLNDVETKLAQSTETTPRSQVLDILDGEKARIASEVGTTNDKALNKGINTIKKKIEANYPEELSQTELHKLRKEIDSSIPKFTSEAVEQGLNNVRYNLRSGLNDILESNNPGIAKANRRVSELIDIDRMLGNRVRQAANAPVVPGGHILGEVAGSALGAPGYYTGARLAGKALGSPAVLTRAANVLNTFAPKPGLAGAIGSVGAAPVVAPRQPGLAGALQRTQPVKPFKGDIHSAVTQAAPAGPAASTVASPQPAGGLGGALNLENLPQIEETPVNFGGPGKILDLHTLLGEIEKARRPRSALESTPTLYQGR